MELYYNLLGVYSPDASVIDTTKKLAEELLETGYVEDDDVIELAKKTNSVLLVEVEQDDGYMEFIVVSNEGKIKKREIFTPDNTPIVYAEIMKVGVEEYFTKKALKEVDYNAEEYEMSRDQFLEEYLDSYLMEEYEKKKYKYVDNIKKYYRE